jgi:hypothetical protein
MSSARTDEPAAQTQKATNLSQVDWDLVYEAIQAIFEPMAEAIHRRRPDTRSRANRAAAHAFFLFAYRVFDVPMDHAIDPVVVGVEFAPAPTNGGVLVRGDISGEESGRIYFELDESEVPSARAVVLEAARQTATQLSNQVEVVIEALAQPGPPGEGSFGTS